MLPLAEVLLAGVDEDVGDRSTLGLFDVLVGVPQLHSPAVGEQPAHGRLPGTHRPDQDHAGAGRSTGGGTGCGTGHRYLSESR